VGERFFLSQDNDSHWYVVPLAKRVAWDEWCDIPSDDERSWDVPEWAAPVGGSPSLITFTDPQDGSFR
jgi:hypothetical protein